VRILERKKKRIMGITTEQKADSQLFQPLEIGNGKIKLKHRVILAPLTRNRGVPLNEKSTPEEPNRLWYPGDLAVEYYRQRTTDGGLLITEGVPPSLEVGLKYLFSSFLFWLFILMWWAFGLLGFC
jgi:hypothetical protein